jgi:hypothetical protein
LAEWILQFAVSFAFCTHLAECGNFCKIELPHYLGKVDCAHERKSSGDGIEFAWALPYVDAK